MAFKILNSDEIELLTEQQRAYYEEELAVHNERIRFVEQLEKLENAVIQPYQPVLNPIPAVAKAPGRVYSAPEYTVAATDTKIVSAPEAAAVFDQEVTAMVPQCVKVQPASVDHVSTPKVEASALPLVGKTEAPSKAFHKTEQPAPVLAKQKKVIAPAPMAGKLQAAECHLPEMVTAKIPEAGPTPTVSIDTTAIMAAAHAATVPQIGVCAFTAPDKGCKQVPQVVVKPTEVRKFEAPAEAKAALPATMLPEKPAGSFTPPKLEKTAVPHTIKPTVPTKEFAKPHTVSPQLPAMQNTTIPAKTLEQMEPVQAKLDSSVAAPVSLPKAAPTLRQLPKTRIEYPSVGEAPKVTFHGVARSTPYRPDTRTVSVPDVYSDENVRSLLRSDT